MVEHSLNLSEHMRSANSGLKLSALPMVFRCYELAEVL
jgi:hypothetical protein